MATKRKPRPRQWMVDDPDAPGSVGLSDLLVQLPSGDKVSARSVFRAALHIAREERGMPLDIEQSDDEVAAWLETEFGSATIKKSFAVWRSRWIGRTDRGVCPR